MCSPELYSQCSADALVFVLKYYAFWCTCLDENKKLIRPRKEKEVLTTLLCCIFFWFMVFFKVMCTMLNFKHLSINLQSEKFYFISFRFVFSCQYKLFYVSSSFRQRQIWNTGKSLCCKFKLHKTSGTYKKTRKIVTHYLDVAPTEKVLWHALWKGFLFDFVVKCKICNKARFFGLFYSLVASWWQNAMWTLVQVC